MTIPEKNYSMRLEAGLKNLRQREGVEAIYRVDLPLLIEREIYPFYPKAIGWQLGAIHREWNKQWNFYQGIVDKAPRSHLKTFFFFEANALRLCKFYPGIEINYYTSTDGLAIEKLNHVKELAKVPYFKELLDGADINNKGELQFGNGSRISVSGFWSKSRGGHPDVIVLDDIIDADVMYSAEANEKAKVRVAMEILPMAEPHTQIVIIGTVQREDDVYSIDFSEFNQRIKWTSKSYDAIVDEEKHLTLYPEKWDWELLMSKKAEITKLAGEQFFNKEYRNMAVNLQGAIIRPEWKRTYSELPAGLSKYSGWDISVGKKLNVGDYTAKITIALDTSKELPDIYITSVFRERMDFPKRIKAIINQGENENPVIVGIEEVAFQSDTVQVAKSNSNLNIQGVKKTINKVEAYVQTLAPLFENGRVFLKEGDEMQKVFWNELTSLPNGANDDMCDALYIALKVIPSQLFKRASDYVIVV